jgi:transcriptional regulator with XRE-family HTH domain
MFAMAHASYLREKARLMRVERKLTIDELAERLALSRSTVYYWVEGSANLGIRLRWRLARDAQRKGTRQCSASRRLREEAYRERLLSSSSLSPIRRFGILCVFTSLRGTSGTGTLAICNSDPAVMVLATRWVRRLTEKTPNFLIQYHADQDLDELCVFWAKTLEIDPGTIKLLRQSNSSQLVGRSWRSRHGVLNVRAPDTLLRAPTGLDGPFAERVAVDSDLTLGAWRSLVSRSVWGREIAGSNPAAPIL